MIIYLMVKTHRKTGLKYLCKTTRNPFKYTGSGVDWLKHLKKHGFEHDTIIVMECANQAELYHWGGYYSKLWNVVSGQDDYGNKIWANRIPETGGGLGVTSEIATAQNLKRWSDPLYRQKMIDIHTSTEVKTKQSNNLKSLWISEDFKNKQLASHRSEDYRKRNSILQKEVQNRPEVKAKLSGSNNYRYDHTKYYFVHDSGVSEYCTQYELIKKYNLVQNNLNAVVRKKRKRHLGWSLSPTAKPSGKI